MGKFGDISAINGHGFQFANCFSITRLGIKFQLNKNLRDLHLNNGRVA
jgi:hypothetical protein